MLPKSSTPSLFLYLLPWACAAAPSCLSWFSSSSTWLENLLKASAILSERASSPLEKSEGFALTLLHPCDLSAYSLVD